MTIKYDNMTPKQQQKLKKEHYDAWRYHFVTKCNPVKKILKTRSTKQTVVNKRAMVQTYKESVGCECCGKKFPFFALHLDHLDPSLKTKNYNNTAIHYASSIQKIMEEIRKCQVLCATCHAIKTYKSGDHLSIASKLAKHNVGIVASADRYEAVLKELLAEKGIKRIRKLTAI